MSQTIEGTFRDGTIALDRLPQGIVEARVRVEFVEPPAPARRRGVLRFGMFAKPGRPFTSDEDIEAAKKAWNRSGLV